MTTHGGPQMPVPDMALPDMACWNPYTAKDTTGWRSIHATQNFSIKGMHGSQNCAKNDTLPKRWSNKRGQGINEEAAKQVQYINLDIAWMQNYSTTLLLIMATLPDQQVKRERGGARVRGVATFSESIFGLGVFTDSRCLVNASHNLVVRSVVPSWVYGYI